MLHRIYRYKEALRNLNPLLRRAIKIVLDGVVVLFSLYLSYLVRFEWTFASEYQRQYAVAAPVIVLITIAFFMLADRYSSFWVWWNIRDLKTLVIAHTAVVTVIFILDVLYPPIHIPRSIFIIYWFFGLGFLALLRLFCRTILEIPDSVSGERKKRLLIIGAGRAAEMLIWQIQSDPAISYSIIGLIDDDPRKRGRSIHGVQVLGNRGVIVDTVREQGVDEIIIALPSAKPREMRKVVDECDKSGAPFKIIPGPKELVDGKVTLNRVRKVNIEDLLGREQTRIDVKRVAALVKGRSVMVTGAAGSIGSELCRQILAQKPEKLVAVDINENGLFYLDQELKDSGCFIPVVTSVANVHKMRKLFEQHRPALVFHAAAYKHVPSMEQNPTEAILNNVESTMVLANLSKLFDVEKFVQISTDKAVNPTNMMGVSKRLCELFCQYLSKNGHNAFISVRFGNVIGSQGSVVTIFEKQIKEGKPITVTHPDMKRYFMSIKEACRLVLDVAAIGGGGYIYILDMGKPIKIVDLARQMIQLAGLIPEKDIPIRFTGTRPGEKLNERLWYPYEKPEKTPNPKIHCTNGVYPFPEEFVIRMKNIVLHSRRLETADMIREIRTLIPEYSGNGFLKEALRAVKTRPSAKQSQKQPKSP